MGVFCLPGLIEPALVCAWHGPSTGMKPGKKILTLNNVLIEINSKCSNCIEGLCISNRYQPTVHTGKPFDLKFLGGDFNLELTNTNLICDALESQNIKAMINSHKFLICDYEITKELLTQRKRIIDFVLISYTPSAFNVSNTSAAMPYNMTHLQGSGIIQPDQEIKTFLDHPPIMNYFQVNPVRSQSMALVGRFAG